MISFQQLPPLFARRRPRGILLFAACASILTSTGIGMHVGPIPKPGRPASHGCIRMPRTMAELLYANAPLGTPVAIVP